jgi:cytochrome b561
MTTESERFTTTAVVLHWVAAALILCTFPLGLYMADLPLSPTRIKLFSYHKWLGVTILLLSVARLLWRAQHPAPALPESMPAWQQLLAHSVQHVIYLLLFVVPITGWLMSSAKGFQTVYLGLIPLPDLLEKNKALGDFLEDVHASLNWLLLAMFVLHVAGALKHHFIEKNELLTRMVPWLAKGKRA